MHHDEANQAVKFGALLETGEYRYDRTDHHGPTLYYLTLPAAWARGQRHAGLARRADRPDRAGAVRRRASAALPARWRAVWAAPPSASPMLLAALSPALVYYSRFYIQESIVRVLRDRVPDRDGAVRRAPDAGRGDRGPASASGLAYATKETSVIVVPAAMAAVAVARHWPGPGGRRLAARMMDERGGPPIRHLAAGRGGGTRRGVAVLLVVPGAPGGFARFDPRVRGVRRARHRRQHRIAAVALLPRPARRGRRRAASCGPRPRSSRWRRSDSSSRSGKRGHFLAAGHRASTR